MTAFSLRCVECGYRYEEDRGRFVCDDCAYEQEAGGPIRGVLDVELEELPASWPTSPPSSREFLEAFLPLSPGAWLPPLPVGDTPLLDVPELRLVLGLPHLYVKDDTRNPSGSTKDRASWLVVAKAREYGIDTIATASTGNAATALAAVAAASGIRAIVFVPANVPEAKLVQMLSYGAEVLPVQGNYDDAFDLCLQACGEFGWYNRNTAINPFTVEGKKTVALEIALSMAPSVPDAVIVPTGDGVVVAGVAKGFADLVSAGLIERAPRLIAVQPEGSAAIVHALRDGTESVSTVPGASSVADSLVVERPRNAILALQRIRESGGGGVAVDDAAILESIPFLARHTGVFAEPAAAASLAGLRVALDDGLVSRDERIVLLVTGSGLKDVPAAARAIERLAPIPPDIGAVERRLARES